MIEYTNSQFMEYISEYIHSDRDRAILEDRFVHGKTFSELEATHHLSERQLKRIVKKADTFFVRHLLSE